MKDSPKQGPILPPLLDYFAEESSRIEGIHGEIPIANMSITLTILLKTDLQLSDIVRFVKGCDGELRDRPGMNVRVGKHIAPPGGPDIQDALAMLLYRAVSEEEDPYLIHCEFEILHPFTDGNGRTGRAIWLWQMIKQHNYDLSLLFLHKFYYQTLDHAR